MNKENQALHLEDAFAAVPRAEEDDLLFHAQGSPRLHFEYLRHLYPALIEYRGGLFVEDAFDKTVVDDILFHSDEADPLVAAQCHVNAISLDSAADAPFEPVLARAIGEGIAYVWRNWIRDRFGCEIITAIDIREHEGVVWFRVSS